MKLILLTRGLHSKVDNADFHWLSQWKWHAVQTAPGIFYAARSEYCNGKKKMILMHRAILNAPEGKDVDHGSGGRLDNQRHNLRLATRSQNLAAKIGTGFWQGRKKTSSYRGVCSGWKGIFTAQISFEGRKKHLGSFDSEEDAARAYDAAARNAFGEFAKCNFPLLTTNQIESNQI